MRLTGLTHLEATVGEAARLRERGEFVRRRARPVPTHGVGEGLAEHRRVEPGGNVRQIPHRLSTHRPSAKLEGVLQGVVHSERPRDVRLQHEQEGVEKHEQEVATRPRVAVGHLRRGFQRRPDLELELDVRLERVLLVVHVSIRLVVLVIVGGELRLRFPAVLFQTDLGLVQRTYVRSSAARSPLLRNRPTRHRGGGDAAAGIVLISGAERLVLHPRALPSGARHRRRRGWVRSAHGRSSSAAIDADDAGSDATDRSRRRGKTGGLHPLRAPIHGSAGKQVRGGVERPPGGRMGKRQERDCLPSVVPALSNVTVGNTRRSQSSAGDVGDAMIVETLKRVKG